MKLCHDISYKESLRKKAWLQDENSHNSNDCFIQTLPLTDISAFIYRKVYFSNKTIFCQPFFQYTRKLNYFYFVGKMLPTKLQSDS